MTTKSPLRSPARALILAAVFGTGLGMGPWSAPCHAEEGGGSYQPGKGVTWQSADGDAELNLGERIQARYTNLDLDAERGRDDVSEFTAERVRLFLKGHVFQDLEFKFQADFGKGEAKLKDASLNWARVEQAQLMVGQFYADLDWQGATSSGKWSFVEEALATDKLDIEREIGVKLHGRVAGGKFGYALGIYDGEGEGGRNPNEGHLIGGSISFMPLGEFKRSESDIDRGEPRIFFNLSGARNEDLKDDSDIRLTSFGGMELSFEDVATLTDEKRYSAGFGWQARGVFLQGEYFWRQSREDFPIASLPEADLDADGEADFDDARLSVDAEGWYLQVGYVFPQQWELAARYSTLDPNTARTHDEQGELMLGFNKFFMDAGHAFKLSADVSWLDEEFAAGGDLEDLRFRLQLQLVF